MMPRLTGNLVHSLFARSFLVVTSFAALFPPSVVAQKIAMSVDATKSGARIDRNIFGQFAEHPDDGVYEGIWVGRTPEPRTVAEFATM
jgi:alpha-N-arabinofuranosidase